MGKIKIREISEGLKNKADPNHISMRSALSDENVGEFYNIPIDKIVPYRNQSRVHFDEEEIKNLADTIAKHGVRQPLTVILNDQGLYEVVSGERRLRAAKLAALQRVPCIVVQDENQAEELAIIENLQRSDLHPIEVSSCLNHLINKGYSQKEICEKLSLSKTFVSENLKLADLDPALRSYLIDKKITSREILRDVVSGKHTIESLDNQIVSRSDFAYKRSQSIFRVGLVNGEYKVQKGSLSQLSEEQKRKLRTELHFIIKEYLS